MIDVFSFIEKQEYHPLDAIDCSDHKSLVRIVDIMPRMIEDSSESISRKCDQAVVQAARVSYGLGLKSLTEDIGLIRYLYRHSHTTPFEMVEFKFHCKMPIFVARQFIRHRTANVNEVSGRYSVLPDNFYYPSVDNVRSQSTSNKQSSDNVNLDGNKSDNVNLDGNKSDNVNLDGNKSDNVNLDGNKSDNVNLDGNKFINLLESKCIELYSIYENFIANGVGKEQSRMILPLNIYTEWYWKIDLHNLLHFLKLRCDKHAQWEIRVFADAMLDIVRSVCPITISAWEDYNDYRSAIKLSSIECKVLKKIFEVHKIDPTNYSEDITNKRELEEFVLKMRKVNS